MFWPVLFIIVGLLFGIISLIAGEKPRKWIVVLLCILVVVGAGRDLYQEIEVSRKQAQQTMVGTLDRKTLIQEENGARFVSVRIGDSGTYVNHLLNPRQDKAQFFQGVTSLSWIPVWFRIEGDRALVTADIFDEDGKIIAKLVDNEWQVMPPPATLDRNYTKTALEVIDASDEVVLQVIVHKDHMQFQCKLHDPKGTPVFIGAAPTENPPFEPDHPAWNQTSAIAWGPRAVDHHIKRYFRYPSKLHFGERTDQ